VRFFTTNPTKLSLHLSDVSTILYTIYKKQQKHFTIEVSDFYQGPWTLLLVHKYTPTLHETPWNQLGLRNWVPRGGRRRSGRNSGELAGARGRGGAGNARGVSRAWFAPDLGAGAASVRGLDGGGQRPAPGRGNARRG
jgi:hypothetical protein